MFIAIGIVFLLVYGLIVFYIGWSGWSWMRPSVSRRFRLLYIAALIFLAASFILARVFAGSTILNIIGSYWLAIFSLLVLMLPVVHLIIWLSRLTSLPRHHVQKWAGIVTLTALVLLIGYGSYNAYTPTVRSYDISIDKPGPASGELKIAMASDMHFGYLSGKNHAIRLVEEINALEPDIVLFPGDIIDDDIVPYKEKGIGEILSRIEAPYGVYASLGNHDRFNGEMQELIDLLEESGMKVLYDEYVEIEDWLTLIGRKDYSDKERAELAELTEGVNSSNALMLLDHQPLGFDIAQRQGIDLVVSGHTHRGQIAPAHLVTQRLFENDWGYLQKDQLHTIVSSGFGFWGPPIRIGSQAEVVLIHATFSNKAE
ncbi:metallophosphoesterase [Paenibacillus sp. 1011MAR3C5]|uniref:metallophosphoesterase n=1 Tax=Paenibacillus sp. 1011MAR3C5 TaxID=1675787 RepID=UPI000E6B6A34|nr:metallophosphoesterase [Paenibacillus sp. 1011MAR3C5]RJE87718.1 metallophosphoesterase [Paenibacillus sp. 1011MAR3C5]